MSGRYSNPPLQPVDLAQRVVADSKKRATSTEKRPPKQQQRRLSADDVDRLKADYLTGVKITDLASRFGIGRQTVLEHVRRSGLPRRHSRLTPEETALAIELYLAGNSLATVGGALAVDPGTVRRALIRSRVSIRDPQGRDR